MTRPKIAVLIVAAGQGTRAHAGSGGALKQYRDLAGKPLIAHSLARFIRHPKMDSVLVVRGADHGPVYDKAVHGFSDHKRLRPAAIGGATRQASVLNGLEALAAEAPDFVLIHDAARPLVDDALIDRVIAALSTAPGAIPASPIAGTIKRADGANTIIAETIPREGLFSAETPQGFAFPTILRLHREAGERPVTDDAQLLERAGLKVALVEGSSRNIKVTVPDDFALAEALLAAAAPANFRTATGSGFDVHRLGPGEGLWLGGLFLPGEHRLIGHSDADVALHAVTDAILGALGAGDIGDHFPPADDRWRGAPSDQFLAHAAGLAVEARGRIEHLDLTIICERPRIKPHREAMRERIAGICGLPLARVSVKATTTEGLGFTGRGEGIAAQAIATLSLPSGADD